MISTQIYQTAKTLNEARLSHVNYRDLAQLLAIYSITALMLEEIKEAINDVGVDLKRTGLKLSLAA